MRRFAAALLLSMFALACWAGTTAKSAEYTTSVHVTASHMVLEGNSIAHHQHLGVVIEGKKYELESIRAVNSLLMLGDYKAKLVKDIHGTTYDSWQVYEFLLPDNKTRQFLVVGTSE
jgi:hypothetical protein